MTANPYFISNKSNASAQQTADGPWVRRLRAASVPDWIEGRIVVPLPEQPRALVIGMSLKLVTHIAIEPQVMGEIVTLKDSVLLHHPMVLFRDERLQNRPLRYPDG